MPYEWTTSKSLELRPHRSLPRKGFAVVILLFFTLVSIPLTAMVGTKTLWGLLPFAMAALAALWWGLQRSYRDGDIHEELLLRHDEVLLTRTNPDGSGQVWRCNPYWVRVSNHETGGPVPYYVTLNGNGREVEIGAFLSEDERKALFEELKHKLAQIG